MREISLVHKLEFPFEGNVVRNALTFGDVDNDGQMEFVIGNNKGELSIYRCEEKLASITDLGFIACIRIGNVLNNKKNNLIIVTGDGWCFVYEAGNLPNSTSSEIKQKDQLNEKQSKFTFPTKKTQEPNETTKPQNESLAKEIKTEKYYVKLVHAQRIPANIKDMILADIDNDGVNEIVFGLTDRVIRSYRYDIPRTSTKSSSTNNTRPAPAPPSTPKSKKAGENPKPAKNHKKDEHSEENTAATAASAGNCSVASVEAGGGGGVDGASAGVRGKFIALNKWECANQIGSISFHHSIDGRNELLVAQPGGTFMRIRCKNHDEEAIAHEVLENEQTLSDSESISSASIDYQFLGKARMRNPEISTEILGGLRTSQNCVKNKEISLNSSNNSTFNQSSSSSSNTSEENIENNKNDDKLDDSKENNSEDGDNANQSCCSYAVATLDGTVLLVQNDVILWAIAVDHQLFALTKLDITGDGRDEIVVCSWDGITYLIDHDKNCVRFQTDDSIQAFQSGFYTVEKNRPPVTCLAYYTFKNTIVLYYDIPLKTLSIRKFEPSFDVLVKYYVKYESCNQEEAELKAANASPDQKNDIVSFLLYKVPRI